jgi:hypothetical protein
LDLGGEKSVFFGTSLISFWEKRVRWDAFHLSTWTSRLIVDSLTCADNPPSCDGFGGMKPSSLERWCFLL